MNSDNDRGWRAYLYECRHSALMAADFHFCLCEFVASMSWSSSTSQKLKLRGSTQAQKTKNLTIDFAEEFQHVRRHPCPGRAGSEGSVLLGSAGVRTISLIYHRTSRGIPPHHELFAKRSSEFPVSRHRIRRRSTKGTRGTLPKLYIIVRNSQKKVEWNRRNTKRSAFQPLTRREGDTPKFR